MGLFNAGSWAACASRERRRRYGPATGAIRPPDLCNTRVAGWVGCRTTPRLPANPLLQQSSQAVSRKREC